jgi:putative transposase
MDLRRSRGMPRIPRRQRLGRYYHVLNRGNDRRRLFQDPPDYDAFVRLLEEASGRYPVSLLAYCLMPNHWHLVVCPEGQPALSAYVHWLTNAHIRRRLRPPGILALGHIYQGRFKSVPIDDEGHLLTALRYVESNARRAGLVTRAEHWPWGSASGRRGWLSPWPMDYPARWLDVLNDGVEPEVARDESVAFE